MMTIISGDFWRRLTGNTDRDGYMWHRDDLRHELSQYAHQQTHHSLGDYGCCYVDYSLVELKVRTHVETTQKPIASKLRSTAD